jgi:hypothetical protein
MRRNIFQKTAVVFWVFGGGVLVERLYSEYGHHSGGKETPVLILLSLTSLVVGSVFQYIGSSTTRTRDQ